LGWSNVSALRGGIGAWGDMGGEIYAGLNVPSKAFGEHVEATYATPSVSAAGLRRMLAEGANVVVLDARPFEEFEQMNLPSAINCPGAELVFRVKEIVRDPDTLVVVNCAGRTRSIVGCQSILNAGIENTVVALRNGTMGWELAGFEIGHSASSSAPPPGAAARSWAERAASHVANRFGVKRVDAEQFATMRREASRTTFLLDVRTAEEFRLGHLPGSDHAPGGQLVQATDTYVATRNARLVLFDDKRVRALMTASWLRQMGWNDTYVLECELGRRGPFGDHDEVELPESRPHLVSVAELASRLNEPDLVVLDLDTSKSYRNRGHVPGAWWGVRSRIGEAFDAIGPLNTLVISSSDGRLARFAVADAREFWHASHVCAISGGTNAWLAAGFATETGFVRATTEADDVWYTPYDFVAGEANQRMKDYLSWEIALVDQIARDPTVSFPSFG
jgi:rhodanese-related sulfurtransferase